MSTREPPAQPPAAVELLPADGTLEPLIDRAERAVLAGDLATLRALVGQLWPGRQALPELLTRRLVDGRTRAPLLTLELMTGFAGRAAPTYLRRVADHPAIADLVRWSARRQLGWPDRGQARRRLAFLASLRDPDRALVEATVQATTAWPPDGELLAEVLGYCQALPSARRVGLAQRIAGALGSQAAWLLHALLQVDDAAAQRLVLAELGRLRPPGAAGATARLARTARTAGVRAEAAVATQRLRLRVVGDAPPASEPLPPLTQALLSALDGDGSQIVFVVRQWPDGLCLMAHFLVREGWGLRDVFGQTRATADRLAASLARLHEQGIPLVTVDLPTARGALADALDANEQSGRRLPAAFELWEPLLHDQYPPPADEPAVRPVADDAAYAGRDDLLAASGRLADHPFFQSWGFPGESRELALAALRAAAAGSGRIPGRALRAALASALESGARERLRERLLRQAWLLERTGDGELAALALAVAAQLASAPLDVLTRQPFLLRLASRAQQPAARAIAWGA